MATASELTQIENLIWVYWDTADIEQRKKLLKVLRHQLKLYKLK